MLTIIIARGPQGKAVDFGNPRGYTEQIKRACNMHVATALAATIEVQGVKVMVASIGDQTSRAEEALQRFLQRPDKDAVMQSLNVVAIIGNTVPVKEDELTKLITVGNAPLQQGELEAALANVVPTAHVAAIGCTQLLQGNYISLAKETAVTQVQVQSPDNLVDIVRAAAQQVAAQLVNADPEAYLVSVDSVGKLLTLAQRLGILSDDQVRDVEDNIDSILAELSGEPATVDLDDEITDDDDDDTSYVDGAAFIVNQSLDQCDDAKGALTYALIAALNSDDFGDTLADQYDSDDVEAADAEELQQILVLALTTVGEDNVDELVQVLEDAAAEFGAAGSREEETFNDREVDDEMIDEEAADDETYALESSPTLRPVSVVPHFILNFVGAGPVSDKEVLRKLLAVSGSDNETYSVANPLSQESKTASLGILRRPLQNISSILEKLHQPKLLVQENFDGAGLLEALEKATGTNLSDALASIYVVGNDDGEVVLDFDEVDTAKVELDSLAQLNTVVFEDHGVYHIYVALNFKVLAAPHIKAPENLGQRLVALANGFAQRGINAYAAVTFNAVDTMLTQGYGKAVDAVLKGAVAKLQADDIAADMLLVNSDYSAFALSGTEEDWAATADTEVDDRTVAMLFDADVFGLGGTTSVVIGVKVEESESPALGDDGDEFAE